MKKLTIISFLLLSGCAAHKQLRCRFVAVDGSGAILRAQTARMHSHWHPGMSACTAMITALANGTVVETITGNEAGVEAKGPMKMRLKLKRLFDSPLPPSEKDRKGIAERPNFKILWEVAE